MKRWETDYDRWKTTPPEPKEAIAGYCYTCDSELYHMDTVYRDSRVGENFCNKECFKKYVFKYINDEIEEYIDFLEGNRDTEYTIIEKS